MPRAQAGACAGAVGPLQNTAAPGLLGVAGQVAFALIPLGAGGRAGMSA